jgi:Ca-activated chloride channel family protein
MFRFQHFEYFWLLLLLPLAIIIYIGFLKWSANKFKKFGDPSLTRHLLKGKIQGRRTTKFVLLLLALSCGIIGLANLQMGGHATKGERKGIDVFFVLDVSKSMLARDISPDRLSRAKQLISRMMDKMHNDRVGLVVFAGKAYLQVPLTIDYSAMKMLLSSVSPDMIPTQGTVLADALNLANTSFNDKEKKHKAVVLISDGEDHDSKAVSAAKELTDNGGVIFTVGVGSPQGSTIFDPSTGQAKVDKNGNTVITKLNEEELRDIASAGDGSYQLLGNADRAAGQLIDQMDKIQTKSLGEVVFTDYDSYFQYFLGAALVFLILEWSLPAAKPFMEHSLDSKKLKEIK